MDEVITRDAMTDEEKLIERRARRSAFVIIVTLILTAILGVGSAFYLVQGEKARDVLQWQIRLGIVADSRTQDVSRWVQDRFQTLRDLAQNPALQLYMTNLSLGDAPEDSGAIEGDYLRNMLNVAAARDGFLAQRPGADREGLAPGDSGLAILDEKRNTLAATPGMPAISPDIQGAIDVAATDRPGLMDIKINAAGKPVMGFAIPVYGIQGGPGESPAIGFIVGILAVGDDLFSRLKQPGDVDPSAETILVRAVGDHVEYISPLSDGTPPLTRNLALNTPNLASAHLVRNIGAFGSFMDYSSHAVLATSRNVPGTSWILIRKVNESDALASTNARLRMMLGGIVVVIIAAVAFTFALWRHGSSIRVSRLAIRYKAASELFERLLKFLRTVTDSMPANVFCCDKDGSISFANKPFAAAYGIMVKSVKGKNLVDILGPARAAPILEVNDRVIRSGERETRILHFEENGHEVVYSSEHIPIQEGMDNTFGVLNVLTDLTELTRARDRSEDRLNQLVAALVRLVDRRDPFSADHSARTTEVASSIAEEMNLDPQEIATVRFTAQLMNLGKIVIPESVLTKTEPLTEEEKVLLGQSFETSSEIVSGVAFDGPVAESIRQIAERWDGKGPLQLSGKNILLPARIVAVANAFAAMASPRAYRDAMPFEQACRILEEQTGSAFDKRPVAALINLVVNRSSSDLWSHFKKPREF